MTFLKTRYRLARAFSPKELERLNQFSTQYGIRGLSLEGQNLTIDYDASRLHEAAVLAAVRAIGVPVEPIQAILPGAFDYTGEFRDFAWPAEGLSPVNQKLDRIAAALRCFDRFLALVPEGEAAREARAIAGSLRGRLN